MARRQIASLQLLLPPLAVSPEQSKLAVGTYGGMLHVLDLRSKEMDEYGIGTGTLRELERYVLWRGEEPLWAVNREHLN